LIRKGHAIRIALAGADTSQFERIPADTKPLLTFYRTSAYASAIMLPVKEKP
jgi:predicted acyl esterase